MEYELNKLKFIDSLDIRVPNCVLFEIANNRSVAVDESKLESMTYRARVFSLITKAQPVVIRQPFDQKSLSEAAAFLNPSDVSWSHTTLTNTFELVWNKYWTKRPVLSLITPDTVFGYPTLENTDTVTPVIAYVILLSLKVRTTHHTSFQAMTSVLKSAGLSRRRVVKDISVQLPSCSSDTLLSIMAIITDATKSKKAEQCKFSSLSKSITQFSNKCYVGDNFIPKNSTEAVAAAIVFYSLDISLSKDPLKEYASLVMNREYYDKSMRDAEKANSDLFDLTQYFNPSLPCNAYIGSSLRSMLRKEGISSGGEPTHAECHNRLMFKYSVNRFHYSVVRGTNSYETAIFIEDVRESTEPRVSYGCTANGFDVHLVVELIGIFREEKHFINPRSAGDTFDRDSIAGLKAVCCYGYGTDGNAVWNELLGVIQKIEKELPGIKTCADEFVKVYNESSPEDATRILDLLYSLLYAALRMRGWNGGTSKWPIKYVPTITDADLTAAISSQYLVYIEEERKKMGRLGTFIMSLPLVFIKNGETYVNMDASRGLTIQGRISLVLTRENVNGCTQTSSNYFLITVHHYLTAIGVALPYTPKDVHLL